MSRHAISALAKPQPQTQHQPQHDASHVGEPPALLYERDYVHWLIENAALLRAGQLDALANETGLPEATFPPDCPYSIDGLLDLDHWPEQTQARRHPHRPAVSCR